MSIRVNSYLDSCAIPRRIYVLLAATRTGKNHIWANESLDAVARHYSWYTAITRENLSFSVVWRDIVIMIISSRSRRHYHRNVFHCVITCSVHEPEVKHTRESQVRLFPVSIWVVTRPGSWHTCRNYRWATDLWLNNIIFQVPQIRYLITSELSYCVLVKLLFRRGSTVSTHCCTIREKYKTYKNISRCSDNIGKNLNVKI